MTTIARACRRWATAALPQAHPVQVKRFCPVLNAPAPASGGSAVPAATVYKRLPAAYIASLAEATQQSTSQHVTPANSVEAASITPHAAATDSASGVHMAPAATQATPAAKPKTSYYRRPLPSPPAISFSSPDGKAIFREALASGSMETYFALAEQFQTQSEPAYCGLSSLAMVLNSLAIDPGRIWKGGWRWVHESMLECCMPLAKVEAEGTSFHQIGCLARCNGAKVESYYASADANASVNEAFFRKIVKETSVKPDVHLIVSYARSSFGQTGSGHFSPIGGYHEEKDLVLVMDVARFKYPPHWVPLSMMYKSMTEIDTSTGLPRGFMVLSRPAKEQSTTLLFAVARSSTWKNIRDFYVKVLPSQMRKCGSCTGHPMNDRESRAAIVELLRCFFAAVVNTDNGCILSTYARELQTSVSSLPLEHQQAVNKLISEIRSIPLYDYVVEALSDHTHDHGNHGSLMDNFNQASTTSVSDMGTCAPVKMDPCGCSDTNAIGPELATVLALASTDSIWTSSPCLPVAARNDLTNLLAPKKLPSSLQHEVKGLRLQLAEIIRFAGQPPLEEVNAKPPRFASPLTISLKTPAKPCAQHGHSCSGKH